MKLLRDNVDLLRRLLSLIELLDNKIWRSKVSSINNETIGRHCRHIADFYLQFINGLDTGCVDYDKRNRNILFEENLNVAKSVIEDILHAFSKNKIKDNTLKINMNQSMKSGSFNSNVKRELMFLYDHTIHHAHIIQIAVSNEFYHLNFKDEFYSPSTIESKECVK